MTITAITFPKQEKWAQAAKYLRELADRYERGEILDCVVVLNDKDGPTCESWGDFEDRWRIYGALEFAKAEVGLL